MTDEETPLSKAPRSTPRSRGKKIVPAGMTIEQALEIAIQAEEHPSFERIEPHPRVRNRRATNGPADSDR